MTATLHEGLRHVAASPLTLSVIMDDGHAMHLQGEEVARVLNEVAKSAPELLHLSLEHRLVSLIAAVAAHCASCDGHACET